MKDIWRGKKGTSARGKKETGGGKENYNRRTFWSLTIANFPMHSYKSQRKEERKNTTKGGKIHYITCTSSLVSFFKVGLERTKGLELFNDIIPGKYCTWGSILPPLRGYNSAVRQCFLACRQKMNWESSVCSLKIA